MAKRIIEELTWNEHGEIVTAIGEGWAVPVQTLAAELAAGVHIYVVIDKKSDEEYPVYCDSTMSPGKINLMTEPPSMLLLNIS